METHTSRLLFYSIISNVFFFLIILSDRIATVVNNPRADLCLSKTAYREFKVYADAIKTFIDNRDLLEHNETSETKPYVLMCDFVIDGECVRWAKKYIQFIDPDSVPVSQSVWVNESRCYLTSSMPKNNNTITG